MFAELSAGAPVEDMAARVEAPAFMVHDLRKLLATVGERLGVGDTVLRKVLNHTPPQGDVLYRHYVELNIEDIRESLTRIQENIATLCQGR